MKIKCLFKHDYKTTKKITEYLTEVKCIRCKKEYSHDSKNEKYWVLTSEIKIINRLLLIDKNFEE